VAELFHADRCTDRHDATDSHFSKFFKHAYKWVVTYVVKVTRYITKLIMHTNLKIAYTTNVITGKILA